jgi:hypothetical protein
MSLQPRTGRLFATPLMVCLTLAGCQANPEPAPLPSPEPAPSASPSPTAAAPTLPPDARGTSMASAKAFVRHYVALVNHAMVTGDTQGVRKLALVDCSSCANIANRLDDIYRAGGSIESEGWRIHSLTPVANQRATHPALQMGMALSSQRVREREGAKVRAFDGGRQPMTIFLERRGGSWRVARLDLVV